MGSPEGLKVAVRPAWLPAPKIDGALVMPMLTKPCTKQLGSTAIAPNTPFGVVIPDVWREIVLIQALNRVVL